jgi:hypothetical protein
MFEIKPELREGEAVLGEYAATVYQVRGGISSAGSNIRLFLTNQRLILKAGIGPQRALPIHAISNIREEKIGFYTMACLEFSDGHLEWFTVQDQAQFLQILQSARVQAPEIPNDIPQGSLNPAANPSRNRFFITVLIIAGCILACICLLALLVGAYLFFVQAQ